MSVYYALDTCAFNRYGSMHDLIGFMVETNKQIKEPKPMNMVERETEAVYENELVNYIHNDSVYM